MMFSRGLNGSATPISAATSGINCIRPCAPTGETASASNADSIWMTDRLNAGSRRYRSAASTIAPSYASCGEIGVMRSTHVVTLRGGRPAIPMAMHVYTRHGECERREDNAAQSVAPAIAPSSIGASAIVLSAISVAPLLALTNAEPLSA